MGEITFAAAILMALPYFLHLESDYLRNVDKQQFYQSSVYDFIVVGGGTAGCIMASRLSEKFSVLLIEAGGEPPSVTAVPAFSPYVLDFSDINYKFTSIPQRNANNRKLEESTGKMLGGSGSHNGMIYNRGNPRDYDTWAKITGDPSWKYDALLPYFRRAESYNGIWNRGTQHGSKGPISVVTSKNPLNQIWNEAAAELGYRVMDPNGPQEEGLSPIDVTTKKGRRVSAYTAYIQPVIPGERLTIVKYASVEEIIFSNLKATGVRYIRHGVEYIAHASKEVIICAGAFGSPLLLFKSGIGPSEMLASANINININLPSVGQNLQNHFGVSIGPINVSDPSKLFTLYNNLTEDDFSMYLNYMEETVLSETNSGPQAFLVSRQAIANGEHDWPDITISTKNTIFGESVPSNQFYILIALTRPKSLGSVQMNTTAFGMGIRDNTELALVDFATFTNSPDLEVLLFGIQEALNIFSTNAFAKIGTKFAMDPECVNKCDTDSFWKSFIKNNVMLVYHPAGTCRMGYGPLDLGSVVNSELRVHGIQNLRVVDASVMPKLTNSNINSAVVVIAEKISAVILQDYTPVITGFDWRRKNVLGIFN